MPGVSVIIPTHNRPQMLARAAESARAAGRDVEIVVVDDGSAAETAAVCRGLEGVRVVRLESRRGVAGARNAGLLACTREFVAFLDDDDLRLPGSLDLQARALASDEGAALVYGRAQLADENCVPTGRVYPETCPAGDVFWELLGRNFIPCPAAVFRRSCLRRVGLLDEARPGVEDWDLWVRIAEHYAVAAVEEPVAVYRRASPSSGQYTSDAAGMVGRATQAHRERWTRLARAAAAPPEMLRAARRRFSENMAAHLVCEAGRALAGGDLKGALGNASAALRLHPLGLLRGTTRPSNLRSLVRLLRDGRGARLPATRPGRRGAD